jgi:hypothetical protein
MASVGNLGYLLFKNILFEQNTNSNLWEIQSGGWELVTVGKGRRQGKGMVG